MYKYVKQQYLTTLKIRNRPTVEKGDCGDIIVGAGLADGDGRVVYSCREFETLFLYLFRLNENS